MEKKTLILSASIAPVVAIIAMVLLVIIPGKSASSYKVSSDESKEDTELVDISDYSALGKYNYTYNELMGISQDGSSKSTLAKYLDIYYDIVGDDSISEHKEEISQPEVEENPLDGNYIGSGSIDKYGIGMEIAISENDVTGSYWYTKNGSDNRLSLTGYFEGNNLYMEERDEYDNLTGRFEGTFNGKVYEGKWTNPKTGKELNLKVNF